MVARARPGSRARELTKVDLMRVFIADDHDLVRFALRNLLESETGFEVVGEAADGVEAVERIKASAPDIVLLDLRMPEKSGLEVLREIREADPKVKVLVLTSYDDEDEIFGALSSGVSGYVMKDSRPDAVLQAIRAVAKGQTVFDPSVAHRALAGHAHHSSKGKREGLSEREIDVLRLMSKGYNNRQISRALWISEATVKTHVSHIFKKLDVTDRTQAVLHAVRTGIVDVQEDSGS